MRKLRYRGKAYSKNPLHGLEPGAKGLDGGFALDMCWALGDLRAQKGAAHTQTEGAESSVTVVLSGGSAMNRLCDWIVCVGAGGAKSLVLFGTA